MMKKRQSIIIILSVLVLFSLLITDGILKYDFSVVVSLVAIIGFVVVSMFLAEFRIKGDSEGFSKTIDSLLVIGGVLIKKDGEINSKELERVKKYLFLEFGQHVGSKKYNLFKNNLLENSDLSVHYKVINRELQHKLKLEALSFLVGLAVADSAVSKEEEEFLLQVAERFYIGKNSMKTIFSFYNHIIEEDRESKIYRTNSNPATNKAYSVLGLESSASFDEVKSSYRKLVKIFHPDKLSNTTRNKERAKQQFQAIRDAYETIKKKMV